jgi:hypothetical protein
VASATSGVHEGGGDGSVLETDVNEHLCSDRVMKSTDVSNTYVSDT